MPDIEISCNTDVCLITINSAPDRPGIGAQVFGDLWSSGINVMMISSTPVSKGKANITLTVAHNDLNHAIFCLKKVQQHIGAESLEVDSDAALLCISGSHLAQTPGIASEIFKILSEKEINVEAVSTSPTLISCIIQKAFASQATEALKHKFCS
jgi:aspartate kinase